MGVMSELHLIGHGIPTNTTKELDKGVNFSPTPQTESSSLVNVPETLYTIGLDLTPNLQKPQGYTIGTIKNNLRVATQITLKDLISAIKRGCTYCPAEIAGDSHKADNWKSQQIFCVDIDNALKKGEPLPEGQYITPSKALEICKDNDIKPFFLYHSFSSKNDFEKFRICITLDRLITDTTERLNIVKAFISLFGSSADKACTNADRIFYGSTSKCEIYSDLNAVTNASTLLNIYDHLQAVKQPKNHPTVVSTPAPKQGFKINYTSSGSSDWSKAYDADPDQLLFCLDPNADYADWFKYTMAYKAAGGTFNTWVNWCRGSNKWKDSDQKIWRTAPITNNVGQLKAYALETSKGQDYINSLKQTQELAKQDFIRQKRTSLPKEINQTSSKESTPFHLFTFGDTGNAQRLLYFADDNYKFNYTTKKWLYYTGTKWTEDSKNSIEFVADEVRHFMKTVELQHWTEIGAEQSFQKHIKSSLSRTATKNMIEESQHHVAITSQELDVDKYKFNTQTHLIDLASGAKEEHNKSQLVTKVSPCGIPENLSPPIKFLKFLSQVLDDNIELINYIQKLLGYCLTGDTSEQGLYILYGDGRNGKSVFIELIKYLWGDYAQNMQIDTIIKSQFSASSSNPTPDIAQLKGARLVTTVEPNEGIRLDESKVKQFTGGDEITARELHSAPITFKPEFKMFMATNHKPYISGTDFGIWRRIHLIPFTVQIPENQVNKNLLNELKEERDSIFNWILDGYRLYKAYGLKEPPIMEQAKAEYRKEMDVIAIFLDECEEIEIDPNKSISAKELYSTYKNWCVQVGRCPYNSTKFGIEITKRFKKQHTMKGTTYTGIGKSLTGNPYT